ncbi:MAG: indole-3-glycerol-phosphate synthase TrpC, partial [Paludibacteraceae bacterium]|nr:indole-3-glycerol-phosphate synthase TrpC [Paludibacteraceae bacterium]
MYLDKIIARKEEEVAELKRTIRMSDFMESEIYTRVCYSLRRSLLASSTGIISEFKRKSPSKGFINENA